MKRCLQSQGCFSSASIVEKPPGDLRIDEANKVLVSCKLGFFFFFLMMQLRSPNFDARLARKRFQRSHQSSELQ